MVTRAREDCDMVSQAHDNCDMMTKAHEDCDMVNVTYETYGMRREDGDLRCPVWGSGVLQSRGVSQAPRS